MIDFSFDCMGPDDCRNCCIKNGEVCPFLIVTHHET